MAGQREKNQNFISIKGARVHNLKNISLNIPKNKLTVITGLSGSGKSSLAFDTIYAEAERRLLDSFSGYARQFLNVKNKPEVERISGLSPAIAIDQKNPAKNSRSTVGTITEIYDYLRALFVRLGKPHCPACGKLLKKQTAEEMLRVIAKERRQNSGRPLFIFAPLARAKKGEHKKTLERIRKQGFLRVRLDGGIMRTEEALDLDLDCKKKHTLEAVVDRLILDKDTEKTRLIESLETALALGKETAIASFPPEADQPLVDKNAKEIIFSRNFACVDCGFSLPGLEPRLFSFNNPQGACQKCGGLGVCPEVDPELVIPNKDLTLAEGAIHPWARFSSATEKESWRESALKNLAGKHKFSLDAPVKNLSKKAVEAVLFGDKTGNFEGVAADLKKRWSETDSEKTRSELERYMRETLCSACGGKRLKPEARSIFLILNNKEKYGIADISQMPISRAFAFFSRLSGDLPENQAVLAAPLITEIIKRLRSLMEVGLDYLSLERSSVDLAGGEAQRLKLATQISSDLTGVIYVLDEPSVGLHPRDHQRLLTALKNLRDAGNTVLVVEHDLETIKAADWIIDLGPGAGRGGGEIIFEGTPDDLKQAKTLTADYFTERKKVEIPGHKFLKSNSKILKLAIKGASEHNLKNISVEIPLGRLVCVAGVSGSGKSTLVGDILAPALRRHFYGGKELPGKHKEIKGMEHLDKVVVVDQSPIGRTPRSNPATYTGIFSFMRDLFAENREGRRRGFKANHFSFNVKGGRCEECEGQGSKKVEMVFLPDIYVECEECRGARYCREILDVRHNDLNIAEALDLPIEEALVFFKNIPQIQRRLAALAEVGLGYMKLGQPAVTLSGGEAQRLKLADELARKETGRTLYILDEPTVGLHSADAQKLLSVLSSLAKKGNSVLVVEHNLEIIKNADWIIDLGPEGGDKGGEIVAQGAVEDIIKNNKSWTGRWLAKNFKE